MLSLCAVVAETPERSDFDYAPCSSAWRIRYEPDYLFHVLGFYYREAGKRKLLLGGGFSADVEISIPIPYGYNRSLYGRNEVSPISYHRVLGKNFSFLVFAQGIPAVFISISKA